MRTNFDEVIATAKASGLHLINLNIMKGEITFTFANEDRPHRSETLAEYIRRIYQSMGPDEARAMVRDLTALAEKEFPAKPAGDR